MNIKKALLKPSDVAPLLGVTTGRIYQLIHSGSIPAVRVGRSIRIPRSAWETWLKAQGEEALNASRQPVMQDRSTADV